MSVGRSSWTTPDKLALFVAVVALLVAALALLPRGDAISSSNGVPSNLRIAVVPAPPVSLYDAGANAAQGHAVEVINAISARADLAVTYSAGNWATMGAALDAGQVDMVVGPVFMTEERARHFAFSKPIYEFAIVPVIAANDSSIRSRNDLSRRGLRVAVGRGGFDADFVAHFMPDAVVSEFPPDDPNLSMLEVAAGRAEVALVDYATAARFGAANPRVRVLSDVVVSRQRAGFMYARQNTALRDFMDVALANLSLAGEASELEAQYAEDPPWRTLSNLE